VDTGCRRIFAAFEEELSFILPPNRQSSEHFTVCFIPPQELVSSTTAITSVQLSEQRAAGEIPRAYVKRKANKSVKLILSDADFNQPLHRIFCGLYVLLQQRQALGLSVDLA